MKIIFFGDVIGKTGRRGIAQVINKLRSKYDTDLFIANAENLAHGYGITDKTLAEMKDAGVDMRFESYEGAVHSFTVKEAGDDPSTGMAYNESADKKSWESMKAFFIEIFGS